MRKATEMLAFGGFLTVREAGRRLIPHGRGAILLTGASASATQAHGGVARSRGQDWPQATGAQRS